ncbi:hypothetical protein [Hymenobacter defluvii]|uniref:XRE family transcriptional regulator n=1 Tax=Hymenobacter defluvii TaxID=2054411 RepID=A0ABS3TH17_9BACT|nr:hypothetical protein [Hymenobacter defluvii]MBO3272964.1 hypothetical protein [Hymenobacter defluvii]
MNSTDTPQTFSQLLREGDKFTERDFKKLLNVGYESLKRREMDPALFTMGELLLLSKLIGKPIKDVVKLVLEEISRNTEAAAKREEAVEQVVGRQRQPKGKQ